MTTAPVATDLPVGRRQQALDRFERAVELPLLVLAVAMVPLLVLPLLVDLPSGIHSSLTALDWIIWAAFAFEYVVRLVLTTARWHFVRREWASLALVVLPFLRPLRIVRSTRALRVLRLTRLLAVLGKAGREARRLLCRHQLHYALLVVLVTAFGAAGITLAVEEGHGGSIDSLGDALWWAITTITTVGYGDTFPVTPAGRGIAVFLMVAGIAFFGVLTANVAAFFLEGRQEEAQEVEATEGADPVVTRLDEVLHRLKAMEAKLSGNGHCPTCGSEAVTSPTVGSSTN